MNNQPASTRVHFDNSRILTFDVIRGAAIFMMVFLHAMKHLLNYDGAWARDTGLTVSIPAPMLIGLGIFLYMGTWDGMFLLVSMVVNVISIQRKLEKGTILAHAVRNRMKWGGVILFLGYINEIFFSYGGIVTRLFRYGEMDYSPIFYNVFTFIALQIIGLSIILSSGILYFLYKNNGIYKIKRNLAILFSLIIVVGVIFEGLSLIIPRMYPGWPQDHHYWTYPNFGELVFKLLLSILFGEPEPLFPYFITALVGTMIGMIVSRNDLRKSFPKYGVLASLGLFMVVIIAVLLGAEIELNFFAPSLLYIVFELAGQILMVSVLFYLLEIRADPENAKNRTRYLRKWGKFALSIYFFQELELIPRYIFYKLTGWNSFTDHNLNIGQALVVVFFVIQMWNLIFKFWAVKARFSLEYALIHLLGGRNALHPSRLQIS